MASDLLSRRPIPVELPGARLTIPFRPAGEWLDALASTSLLAGPLVREEDREVLADLVIGGMDLEPLRKESYRVLEQATGRRWWEAMRLINTSQVPEVLGRMVLAGVDPWSRSIGEWCAATYAVCVKGQDTKGRTRFDFSLSIPPVEYEDEWDDGNDQAAIADALSNLMGR